MNQASHSSRFPAYGPIDAALGYAVFYVFVDRATPAFVELITGVLPGVGPALVRLMLAGTLWFILAATAIDQLRRQLDALGSIDRSSGDREARPASPSGTRAVAYLVIIAIAGAVSALTIEPAIEAGIALIRAVAVLDVSGIVTRGLLVMIVFFVAFAAATRSLDRLVIGVVRWLLR